MSKQVTQKIRGIVDTMSLIEKADGEQGAAALRIEASKHGVDLHDEKQLEAFLLAWGWLYMAIKSSEPMENFTRGVNATAIYLIEEGIE